MVTWIGAEQAMVDQWVESRFADPSVVERLEAIEVGLSERIFQDFALPGTPYPFIIWQCQDPPRDVKVVGGIRVMVDTLYVVKAVAQADSYAPLAPIATVLDEAMTTSDATAVDEGFVLTSTRDKQFSMVERDGGATYRHLGGEYTIQAQGQQ